jgi:Rrf2 family protein
MVKVSRRVEYGLLALKWMLSKPVQELTTAREVCERFDAPFDTLARTLQILHREGVLVAEHGAQGGYRLGVDLSQLSFDKFSRMIIGNVPFVECMGVTGCDMMPKCSIISPMSILNHKVHQFLSTISVLDLIQLGHPSNTP